MGMFNFIGNWRNSLNSISPVNVRKFVDAPITKLTGLSDRQLHPLEGGLDELATEHDKRYKKGGGYTNATDAAMIAAMTMGAGSALGAGAAGAGSGASTASAAPGMYGSYGAGAYGTGAGYGGAGAATVMPAGTAAGTAGTSGGLLGTAGSYAKPAMQSMQAAQMANGLLGGGKQPAPMQAPQNNSAQGAQIMAELYKNSMQGMPLEQQMRMQRRKTMWG